MLLRNDSTRSRRRQQPILFTVRSAEVLSANMPTGPGRNTERLAHLMRSDDIRAPTIVSSSSPSLARAARSAKVPDEPPKSRMLADSSLLQQQQQQQMPTVSMIHAFQHAGWRHRQTTVSARGQLVCSTRLKERSLKVQCSGSRSWTHDGAAEGGRPLVVGPGTEED